MGSGRGFFGTKKKKLSQEERNAASMQKALQQFGFDEPGFAHGFDESQLYTNI